MPLPSHRDSTAKPTPPPSIGHAAPLVILAKSHQWCNRPHTLPPTAAAFDQAQSYHLWPKPRPITTPFSNRVRRSVVRCEGKPERGKIKETTSKFGCSRQAISAIWATARQQVEAGMPIHVINKKRKKVTTSKHKFDGEKLQRIDLAKRGTYRSIAKEMEVSKSTVGRWFKEGLIRAHSNAIKPALTYQNRINRLRFSLESLRVDYDQNVIKFKSMQKVIHIDEKWFNLTRTNQRYYLCPDETEPYRSCQSKRFITKVMFLCAVARPIYASNGECLFDGKIGIFPFTHTVPAKRNSKNRAAGTMEVKALDSITRQVTKDCLINQVLPAIRAKWPRFACKDIIIQQDNARPHIDDDDPDFRVAASIEGYNIHIAFQPPNSPDTNINDLGWFRALQSLQVQTSAYTVNSLLNAVETSFNELSHTTLNSVFLSLQACIEIMSTRGHNDYKVPHIKKQALLRAGILPHVLEVDLNLVVGCMDYLVEANEADGLEELITAIGQMEGAL